MKNEPEWMRNFRLKAYDYFMDRPMPNWGGDLSTIDFDNIYYYAKPTDKMGTDWKDVPENIRKTFDKLGIPEAERKFLGGVGAQYESEVVYHSLREDLEKKGVVFLDTDSALKQYPDIMKRYFGTISPTQRQQIRRAQQCSMEWWKLRLHSARSKGRGPASSLF